MNLNILEKKQDSCAENKVSSVSFAGFSQADENVQGSRRRGIFSAKEELMRKDAVRIGVFCLYIQLLFMSVAAADAAQVTVWNEQLAVIDAQIQAQGLEPTQSVSGQAAAKIVPGVTAALLEQKRQILVNAGFTKFASVNSYGNFYSFTSQNGYTDTQVRLVETTAPLQLLRRGNHQNANEIAQGFLGAWWSPSYYSVEDSRNRQAILKQWGSDLQDIYVISVPAGTTLVAGEASPMSQNGESRSGGAYQYWKRSGQSENTLNWLVYALYAPNYLSSYSQALVGAQRLGREALGDVSQHLLELRTHKASAEGLWMQPYGRNGAYVDNAGKSFHNQSYGLHLGWDRPLKTGLDQQAYWGLVVGQGRGSLSQSAANVTNQLAANYGGVYGVQRSGIGSAVSPYWQGSFLYGHLSIDNEVPGYYGYGLRQRYGGSMVAASLEHGITLRRTAELTVEPQVQLLYVSVDHAAISDKLGATVSVKQGVSLQGRAGLEVRHASLTAQQLPQSVWLRGDYIREFKGDSIALVSGEEAHSFGGRQRYVLSVGAQRALPGGWLLQGQVEKSFGSERGLQGQWKLSKSW